MARLIALAACLVSFACSSAGSALPPRAPHFDPAAFVVADATGVVRTSGSKSPLVAVASPLLTDRPCLHETIDAAQTIYQIYVDHSSYLIVDGKVARDQLEACMRDAPANRSPAIEVGSDGELATFDAERLGKLYVAWRGNLVIAGRKPVVIAALALHDAAQAQIWHDRIANLPTAQFSAWSLDKTIGGFVGLPTVGYSVAMTSDGQVPARAFSIRVAAQFADANSATLAADRLHRGELAAGIEPPPAIVAGLKRARITHTDDRVEIAIDQTTFPDLDLAVLATWTKGMQARLAAPAPHLLRVAIVPITAPFGPDYGPAWAARFTAALVDQVNAHRANLVELPENAAGCDDVGAPCDAAIAAAASADLVIYGTLESMGEGANAEVHLAAIVMPGKQTRTWHRDQIMDSDTFFASAAREAFEELTR